MSERPPFHADHIGSLLRPPELIDARHKFRDGALGENELHAIEDRAICDVVKLQEDIGLPVVTDGEFRRGAFFSHFVKTVDGMTVKATPFMFSNDFWRFCASLRALRERKAQTPERHYH